MRSSEHFLSKFSSFILSGNVHSFLNVETLKISGACDGLSGSLGFKHCYKCCFYLLCEHLHCLFLYGIEEYTI